MLILSRQLHERIVCLLPNGERITFVVLRMGSHSIKVGIDAPDHIPVVRFELLDAAPAEEEPRPLPGEAAGDVSHYRPLADFRDIGPPPPAEACGDVEMAHDLRQAEAL